MLGNIEGKKRKGQQRMRWLDSITDSEDMNLSKLQRQWEGNGHPLQYPCLENLMDRGLVGCSPLGLKELGTTEQLTLTPESEGQGSLVCCSPWGRKELDMTERLNSSRLLLVNLDCCNKIPSSRCTKQETCIFSQFWMLLSPRSGCQHNWCLVRPLY